MRPEENTHKAEVASYFSNAKNEVRLITDSLHKALNTHLSKLKDNFYDTQPAKSEHESTQSTHPSDRSRREVWQGMSTERAKFSRVLHQVKTTLSLFKQIPDHERKESEICLSKGKRKIQKQQYCEAIEYTSKCITLNPSDANAYNNRGYSHQCLNQIEEALSDYNTCLAIDPQNKTALNNKGLLHFNVLKNYEEAVKYYTKCLEGAPSYATALQNRSLAYYKLQKYEESLGDLNRCIQLEPRKQKFKWRAAVYVKLNRLEEAQNDNKMLMDIKD